MNIERFAFVVGAGAVVVIGLVAATCGGGSASTSSGEQGQTAGSVATHSVPPSATATLASADEWGERTQTTQSVPTNHPSPSATSSPARADESGIEGSVLAGPTCPVERVDDPCPDRPLAVSIWVYEGISGTPVLFAPGQPLVVRSGQDGRFRQQLPPGTYTLRGPCGGTMACSPYPRIIEQTVTVDGGAFTPVTLHADTGIR